MEKPQSNPFVAARFLTSVPEPRLAPPDQGVEVAFAGRSNAGKSSALNAITNQKSLARTSKTPGRTQHLVFFELDETHRLVDLPGYGYAKVPEALKRRWGQAIDTYLSNRQSLQGLILMMDIRHPLTTFDRQLLDWCDHCGMRVHILLTKADKLKRGPAKSTLLQVQKALCEQPLTSVQLFSTTHRQGLEEVISLLKKWLYTDPGDAQKKAPA